ncbi:MAG: hypothetical protein WC444_05985 [Candidatus Paceibacterota bacterium]
MDPITYNALVGVIAAGVLAMSTYIRKREQDGTSFEFSKLLATGITGIIVGISAAFMGIQVSESWLLIQLGAYAGFTSILESWIRIVLTKLRGIGVVNSLYSKIYKTV